MTRIVGEKNSRVAFINRSDGGVPKVHVPSARVSVNGLETDRQRNLRFMITSYTKPCRTIRESFAGHHISRISQKVYPGWSRVYARVLREGAVSVGDPVMVL